MVKRLVIPGVLAALAIAAQPARADCGCGAELLTPTVSQDVPRLVLASSCAGKQAVIELEDAAGKRVPIEITATHRGAAQEQYVVEPTGALAAGTYTLVSHTFQRHRHALEIVASSSTAAPPAAPTPKVISQKQLELGCGPAKQVEVALGTSVSLAYVELADTKTKQVSTGYVRVADGALTIGHGMCGGPFGLDKGRGYTATITLIAPELGTTSSSRSVSFTYAP
jgi:hypothetical protein